MKLMHTKPLTFVVAFLFLVGLSGFSSTAAFASGAADDDCVTFSSASRLQLGTMTLQPTWDGTMEYSTDKINWTTWNGEIIDSAEASDGKHYLYVRGDNNTVVSGGTTWALMKPDQSAGHTIDASGNIETLRGATGNQPATTPMDSNCYGGMFNGDQWLSSAPQLTATTLSENCYMQMFQNCISLKQAPELPANTLAPSCYSGMFIGCNGLTTTPNLPAENLAESCYANMFEACYNLTTITALPATIMAESCYAQMFLDCIRLKAAPNLPALTLAESCYEGMFANCDELASAPAQLPATTLTEACYLGMFSHCTSLKNVPELPALVLAKNCYSEMFLGCFSLTVPADMSHVTMLATSCCSRMYDGCLNLGVYTQAEGDHTKPWVVNSATKAVSDWSTDMFGRTYGDFTGSPVMGTTYYVANVAPIVYTAVPADTDNGFVKIHQKYFRAGDIVEVSAVPKQGYVTKSFVVRDADGNETPISNDSFIMPDSNVVLVATFGLETDQDGGKGEDTNTGEKIVATSDTFPFLLMGVGSIAFAACIVIIVCLGRAACSNNYR